MRKVSKKGWRSSGEKIRKVSKKGFGDPMERR